MNKRESNSKVTVKWAHLVSPYGGAFQGFWLMNSNGQPTHPRPFETRKEALEALETMTTSQLKWEVNRMIVLWKKITWKEKE
jgi:hypothetical protein